MTNLLDHLTGYSQGPPMKPQRNGNFTFEPRKGNRCVGLRVWLTREEAIQAIQRLSSQLLDAETDDVELWWGGELTDDDTGSTPHKQEPTP